MTVYAITDTKKGRTGIAPIYLQTTRKLFHDNRNYIFLDHNKMIYLKAYNHDLLFDSGHKT